MKEFKKYKGEGKSRKTMTFAGYWKLYWSHEEGKWEIKGLWKAGLILLTVHENQRPNKKSLSSAMEEKTSEQQAEDLIVKVVQL